MNIFEGTLFYHDSMGLGIVVSAMRDSSFVFFPLEKNTLHISNDYIKTNYSLERVEKEFKGLKDLIERGYLEPFFPPIIKDRAKAYVKKVSISAFTNEILSGSVKGTNMYSLTIKYNEGRILMECDCPYDNYCKHLYALVLVSKSADVSEEVRENIENVEINNEGTSYNEDTFSELMNIRGDYELENIEKMLKLREYLESLSGSSICDYLSKHYEINTGTYRLACETIYLYTPVFEKMYNAANLFLDSVPPIVRVFKKLREEYLVSIRDSRPWMIDHSKRLLFSLINENYVLAAGCLKNGLALNKTNRNIVTYFYEDIYKELKSNEFITKFIENGPSLLYIYNNIKDKDIKLTFYYEFSRHLIRMGVVAPKTNPYEEFLFVSKNIRGPFDKDKILRVIELTDLLVKEGKERELVEWVFHPTHLRYFNKSELQRIMDKLPDNELLLMFMEDSNGR